MPKFKATFGKIKVHQKSVMRHYRLANMFLHDYAFLSVIFRLQKKCFWSEFCDINTRCTKILFFFIKRCKSILINDYIKSWFVLFKYDWINITFNRIRTSDNIAFLVIGAWITLLPVTWAKMSNTYFSIANIYSDPQITFRNKLIFHFQTWEKVSGATHIFHVDMCE